MLEIGTRVMIRDVPDNEYLYQGKNKSGSFMEGEIIRHTTDDHLIYEVRWEDCSENSYGDAHIQPLEQEVINNYQIY